MQPYHAYVPDDVFHASDVAAELRRRLPGIGAKKLHKLLYYCQGHHLADIGQPLFTESIAAWDMGPVVGELWKHEQTTRQAATNRVLDQAALNTVGYVVSRYGALTGRDLQILSHGEAPWTLATARGRAAGDRSPKLSHGDMQRFFQSAEGDDDSTAVLEPEGVHELLSGAVARSASPARADDLGHLKQRLVELENARAGRC
jgi:uncharacterized phage-associated protein